MPQNIGDRTLSLDAIARIADKDVQRLARYATVENDIVYARRGDVEKHVFITKDEAGALCGTGCLRVRVDVGKADPLFVSFFLNRPESRIWLRQHAVGSNMPNLNTDILSALPLDLPRITVQRRIGNLLRAIDDKIENNRKLMAELEATARLVYEEWFVRFDFPDEQGRPYRSSGGKMVWNDQLKREIPKGWKIVTVGDLITVTKGISYTSADLEGAGIPMVNLATFSTDGTIKPDGIKSFSGTPDPRRLVRPGDLLMCVTQQTSIDPTGKTNVIGKTFLMPAMYEGDVVISTDVAKLSVAHSALLAYFDQLFRIPEIHKHIAGYANGTKIKHLDVEGALHFQVPLPERPMLFERFAGLVRHMTDLKGKVLRENESLSSLRDWLLPMLMNGQITIGE